MGNLTVVELEVDRLVSVDVGLGGENISFSRKTRCVRQNSRLKVS